MIEVVEYTDPGCAWCWTFQPRRAKLIERFGRRWRRVMGVLGDGDPRATWREAGVDVGLEWVHSTTRPAALAVKAAELQGAGEAALARLREAFFVDGRPPDTPERIAAALDGVLDVPRLLADLPRAERALDADWEEARAIHPDLLDVDTEGPHPGIPVLEGERLRYAFPTLLFRGPAGERIVPGYRSLGSYLAAAAAVELKISQRPPDHLYFDPDWTFSTRS